MWERISLIAFWRFDSVGRFSLFTLQHIEFREIIDLLLATTEIKPEPVDIRFLSKFPTEVDFVMFRNEENYCFDLSKFLC